MPAVTKTPTVPPRVLERVARETPYVAERPLQPIDLWLDMNEAIAPEPAALNAAQRIDPDAVRRYPDATPIERMLAAQFGIDERCVLATAGGDDGIDRVCRAMLDDSRTLITHTPGFSMIAASARRTGAELVNIPWDQGSFPLELALEQITDRTGVVALVTPNNPTGLVIDRDAIENVARRCASVGAALLLDLAYIEFADDDVTFFALGLPNTVIVRTLSKAYGLAGLRVGFLLGDQRIVDACRAVGGPFALSAPSIAAASSLLTANDGIAPSRERIAGERSRLASRLRSRCVEALDSQANFVLARFKNAERARWTRDALRGLGVAVRGWSRAGDLDRALRITCPGRDDAFARLTEALDAALAPEAMLLDLDGVLADVSRSYRAAILATCESFGVRVAPSDVAAIKARGNANNDWFVTRELLAQRGVALDLRLVTERFEAIYQGEPSRPGLRETESLLGSINALKQLASRIPLAIVTGRPRADAERFLDRFGLSPLISARVCMEDGPSKPDPTVVRLALERLGVRRAWMVGDTVDDVRAARAAGVVPIGVIAPQDEPTLTTDSLLRAGAARVLGSLDELLEILP
jgi:histidinol-phosphate aminotransferase